MLLRLDSHAPSAWCATLTKVLTAMLFAAVAYALLPQVALDAAGQAFAPDSAMGTAVAVTIFTMVLFYLRPVPFWVSSLVPALLFAATDLASFSTLFHAYTTSFGLIVGCAFLLAAEMHYRRVDARLALWFIQYFGPTDRMLLFAGIGLMAFASMWTPNALLAALLLPVMLSFMRLHGHYLLTTEHENPRHFFMVFSIGMAFAITIGGISNIIGHPANIALYHFLLHEYGEKLSLMNWVMMGVIFFSIGIPTTYALLARGLPAAVRTFESDKAFFHFLSTERRKLGRVRRSEAAFLVLLFATLFSWGLLSVLRIFPAESGFLKDVSALQVTFGVLILLFLSHLADRPFNLCRMTDSIRRQPWWIVLFLGAGFATAQVLADCGAIAAIASHSAYLFQRGEITGFLAIGLFVLIVGNLLPTSVLGSVVALFFTALFASVSGSEKETAIILTLIPSASFLLPTGALNNMILYTSGWFRFRDFARYGAILSLVLVPLLVALPLFLNHSYTRVAALSDEVASEIETVEETHPAKRLIRDWERESDARQKAAANSD